MIVHHLPPLRAYLLLSCIVIAQEAWAQTIFRDSFDDGDATDGVPVTWEPVPGFPGILDASSGDYFLAPSQRAVVATVPELILADVSIRTQVRVLEPSAPGGGVELLARVDRVAVNTYLAGLNEQGRVYIRRSDIAGSFAAVDTELRPLEEDIVMQFDVFGDSLSLWAWPANEAMPAAPLVTATDSTLSEGEVGIDYFSREEDPTLGSAVFRYVHVAQTHIPEPSTWAITALLVSVYGVLRLRHWCPRSALLLAASQHEAGRHRRATESRECAQELIVRGAPIYYGHIGILGFHRIRAELDSLRQQVGATSTISQARLP